MVMKSPARGDLTIPRHKITTREHRRHHHGLHLYCLSFTLLQNIPIMHWDGSGVRGSAVQHQTCGTTISKATANQVKASDCYTFIFLKKSSLSVDFDWLTLLGSGLWLDTLWALQSCTRRMLGCCNAQISVLLTSLSLLASSTDKEKHTRNCSVTFTSQTFQMLF